jgi:hypothetical protein
VFDKARMLSSPTVTTPPVLGGQMSAIGLKVKMSTPSSWLSLVREKTCAVASEPSARCDFALSEMPLSSQHSIDDLPSAVRVKAVTRDLPVRGLPEWSC